jgi:hypothetical protein
MPTGRPEDFVFGAVVAIVVTGFIVTTVGDVPYAWITTCAAVIVWIAIGRVLSR